MSYSSIDKNDNTSLEFHGPIGQYLIKKEELSLEQAEEILRYQKLNPGRKFGEIAIELGFIGYEAFHAHLSDFNIN